MSRKNSVIALAGATVLFIASVSLLLYPSTHRDPPRWGGPVDVAVAFAVVGVSMWIYLKAGGNVAGKPVEISYTIATVLPTVVILAMWIFADRLIWNVLLPGVAWRMWLLLYMVPRTLSPVPNPGRS